MRGEQAASGARGRSATGHCRGFEWWEGRNTPAADEADAGVDGVEVEGCVLRKADESGLHPVLADNIKKGGVAQVFERDGGGDVREGLGRGGGAADRDEEERCCHAGLDVRTSEDWLRVVRKEALSLVKVGQQREQSRSAMEEGVGMGQLQQQQHCGMTNRAEGWVLGSSSGSSGGIFVTDTEVADIGQNPRASVCRFPSAELKGES